MALTREASGADEVVCLLVRGSTRGVEGRRGTNCEEEGESQGTTQLSHRQRKNRCCAVLRLRCYHQSSYKRKEFLIDYFSFYLEVLLSFL